MSNRCHRRPKVAYFVQHCQYNLFRCNCIIQCCEYSPFPQGLPPYRGEEVCASQCPRRIMLAGALAPASATHARQDKV
jgi:hypothetical protein